MQKLIKIYLYLLVLLVVSSTILLIYLITQKDPDERHVLLLFFLGLFLACLSSFTLIGFALRRRFGVREYGVWHLKISLRQGLWLGSIVSITLVLSKYDLLTWWNSLLLAFIFIFLESYFISKNRNFIKN